ncbi:NERD domain-containing protein [Nisaea sp.]|uniref:NERD domain-containing protein n=1 Tax=Nisaea sp. TaxID=2024842 RepID=UPI002B2757D6|nr:NERD domain-containing protein [Nisaea sp.]
MATCYPDYGNDESAFKSRGELVFYRACQRSLPPEYSVFHSVSWIARSDGEAHDGEADFLICHPDRGFLVVEVKGGRIRADLGTGKWTSTDQDGRVHDISNPFRQASTGKYNIIRKLREHRDWPKLRLRRVIAGHSAFFPNVDDGRVLQGPEAPPEIIGDRSDLPQLEQWVERAFDYWVDQEESDRSQPLGLSGVQLMRRIFARVVEARPLLSTKIATEEEERLRLTQQQIQILDLLSRQRRVAISGGAGTGKTVLATEKARRLAGEGFKTLLTCYNVPLSEHLRRVCEGDENLEVIGFHKLCKNLVDRAQAESGIDLIAEAKESYPGKDLWDHYYPIALAYALEILADRYDAIVIDEGQDFGEEFWLPIEMLLADGETSPLYIFYDENQNVYTRASTFPADAAPITLTINCRNTKQIHEAAYTYYSGTPVETPSLAGDDIHILDAPNVERQAKRIYDLVTRLLTTEKVPASSIAILIADRTRRRQYQKVLDKFKLPSGHIWDSVDSNSNKSVTVETVARFKGLETGILIIWGLDLLAKTERKETLYVGLSRAKSILYLCGSRETCELIITAS